MKKDLKILLTILFVISISAIAVSFIAVCIIGSISYTEKGVDKINSNILSTIGDYDNVYYQTHHKNIAIFQSNADVLIAEYSPENYEKQKQSIDDEYIFINEPIKDDFDDIIISQYEFSIGEWSFYCCDSDGWTKFEYPKHFRIIGYNDNAKQIAFLDFDDGDLDCISTKWDGFIEDYFKYDFTKATDFS